MEVIYKAHVNENTGKIQTVKEHSENTADLCRQFAIPALADVMYAIGLLHDIGKFQESFQRRIDGAMIRVEHSTCGALAAKERYPDPIGLMMEYCIAGHHSGIPDGGNKSDKLNLDSSTLYGRLNRKFEDFSIYQNELKLPEINQKSMLTFLTQDCGRNVELLVDKFAFLTRYAFSCLVDADSIDTARFCSNEEVKPLAADFCACLQKVDTKLKSFNCTTSLQKTRAVLQQQVFRKADVNGEIFLMNMPTGSGKTLCSVKYTLERAIRTGKKRIIYVIPYNSIIDQTVRVFEELFGQDAEILRHQSTFSYEDETDYTEDYRKAARHGAENWDVASIIVTTAVQFFESVYSNKRGKLRKLHNMADSILIFDEAHLMPQDYLQPCLRAIAYITRYLNSEAVFLTATMPDFSKLLRQYALENSKIVELIDDTSGFSEFQKCRYRSLGQLSTETLLEMAADAPSSLIIVNKKKSAKRLFEQCRGKKYHLTTSMTTYDRERVIREIHTELKQLEKDFPNYESVPEDRRITIMSTSLIEAGVDLDVFTVFRELSGLDSILQAGGRCNREGKRSEAEVCVFEFSDENKTSQDMKSNITISILDRYKDISCQQSIKEYYDRLFFIKKDAIERNTITQNCHDIFGIPFHKYAQDFELIDSKTISLVVPRDQRSQEMVDSLKYTGGGVGIARRLQKYTCSIYQQELDDLIRQHVADDFGTGIWCLTNPDYYDKNTGISFEAKDYFI
ncbi:MAG: CRISPR-associated helicase Cas3' [Lachnospiraceae bacterium]|nr:CRISPR-associated helicase Cas3' [Lachnospiraceae bacterium]